MPFPSRLSQWGAIYINQCLPDDAGWLTEGPDWFHHECVEQESRREIVRRVIPEKSLLEECKNRGIRMTRQRAVILELLDNADVHLDAKTLLEEAKRRVPEIDKTTVYRTIRRLRDLGLIDELDLLHFRHEGHYYEPLPDKMHLHVVCLICGKVAEVRPAAWSSVEREVESDTGFSIELARVEMGGRCLECRTSKPES